MSLELGGLSSRFLHTGPFLQGKKLLMEFYLHECEYSQTIVAFKPVSQIWMSDNLSKDS